MASITTFSWDTVLSPSIFPRTLEDGCRLVERSTDQLHRGIEDLLKISPESRTFKNTVVAYHDLITKFDVTERLIRSERLIHERTPGKRELLESCVRVKEEVFLNPRLREVFLPYDPSDFELEFRYLKGNCGEKVLSEEVNGFSFLTVNLCLMPETTSMIYGGVLPWPVRMDAIAKKIEQINADVIFLQEVYDIHALDALHSHLAHLYAHFYGNVPLKLSGLSHASLFSSSGLAVISKFKLNRLYFEPFETTTSSEMDKHRDFGFDRNYGLLHCDLMSGDRRLAHLVTTHQSPFYADVRELQMRQAAASFEKEAKDLMEPLLLCGDLNMEKDQMNEGTERVLHEHFIDHYHGGPTWYDFGNYWCRKWHERDADQFLNPNPIPWTVDRSLVWKKWALEHPAYSMRVERVRMHDDENPHQALTDHHGILTHFSY